MSNTPDKPRTWEERTVELLLDGASDKTIARHGDLAMMHTRILHGDQCPECLSTNTMPNCSSPPTEGQCADCGLYWVFAEWEQVRIEGGNRLVRADHD